MVFVAGAWDAAFALITDAFWRTGVIARATMLGIGRNIGACVTTTEAVSASVFARGTRGRLAMTFVTGISRGAGVITGAACHDIMHDIHAFSLTTGEGSAIWAATIVGLNDIAFARGDDGGQRQR